MCKWVFDAAAMETSSARPDMLGTIGHTERQYSCSSLHAPDRLQLTESPAQTIRYFAKVETRHSDLQPLHTYILLVKPKDSLCSSILAASFYHSKSRCGLFNAEMKADESRRNIWGISLLKYFQPHRPRSAESIPEDVGEMVHTGPA